MCEGDKDDLCEASSLVISIVGSTDQGCRADGPRGESCAQRTLEVRSESP